jgi:DNA-binding beta-propeller fold protein YncE
MRWRTCACAALTLVSVLAGASALRAQDYEFKVVASGLSQPTGIAVEGSETVYFTFVPTPGVPGANGVARLDLESGAISTLHMGEPEPRNIVVDREGSLYWTCTSAGVILKQLEDGTTFPILTGLERPVGIAVGRRGTVFFTEVPMPGVAGGENRVVAYDGNGKTVLHMGEPEPVDVVIARNGDLYWTCRTAGVILEQSQGRTRVLLGGLDHPLGLALDHKGERLYFTEVPTPGQAGSAGGRNRISKLDLRSGEVRLVHAGDPEPTDVAVARNGNVYWTCTSAGVIVEARRLGRR